MSLFHNEGSAVNSAVPRPAMINAAFGPAADTVGAPTMYPTSIAELLIVPIVTNALGSIFGSTALTTTILRADTWSPLNIPANAKSGIQRNNAGTKPGIEMQIPIPIPLLIKVARAFAFVSLAENLAPKIRPTTKHWATIAYKNPLVFRD